MVPTVVVSVESLTVVSAEMSHEICGTTLWFRPDLLHLLKTFLNRAAGQCCNT